VSLTNLEEQLFDLGIRMSKCIRLQSTLDEPLDPSEESIEGGIEVDSEDLEDLEDLEDWDKV